MLNEAELSGYMVSDIKKFFLWHLYVDRGYNLKLVSVI